LPRQDCQYTPKLDFSLKIVSIVARHRKCRELPARDLPVEIKINIKLELHLSISAL